MIISFEINDKELKEKISQGISIQSICDEAVNECTYDIKNKVLKEIKDSSEYKHSWKDTDFQRIKEAIRTMSLNTVNEIVKNEVEKQLKNTKIPSITKSMINDILKSYVDEAVVKTIQKRYNIAIDIKVNK